MEGVATYFAEGQTWKLAHLVPSGPSLKDRWLYVGPAGLGLGLLDEVEAPSPNQTLSVGGRDLPRIASRKTRVSARFVVKLRLTASVNSVPQRPRRRRAGLRRRWQSLARRNPSPALASRFT